MKRILILVLVASCCALAQDKANVVYQSAGSVSALAWGGFDKAPGTPVQGAPYAATLSSESIQTLADGNRIVQTSTGTTARDLQGRTRQDTVLPAIGNLSAAKAPHLVFIQDPIAQTSYTLNLTEKTAQKMPAFPLPAGGAMGISGTAVNMKIVEANGTGLPSPDALPSTIAVPPTGLFIQKHSLTDEQVQASTEDLGSQTMEGILVNGMRATQMIPAGQIGNDRPITIVTEMWTSPDLKTVVYSKRSDPRTGEQTFHLANIVRAEPDSSLFTVPADFKVIEGPQPILYRTKQ